MTAKFLTDYTPNYETLLRAAKDGNLALLECYDENLKAKVATLVAVNFDGNEYDMVPLGRMFNLNDLANIRPPDSDSESGFGPKGYIDASEH